MISDELFKVLQQILSSRSSSKPVPLHEPMFSKKDYFYLKRCLDSTYVSSVGKFVDEFEALLAQYTGAKYVTAVINGTSALQVALKVAGVRENDEVFVPSLSFVATANAVSYCGAIPFFIDCNERNLSIDAEALEELLKMIGEPTSGGLRNRRTGRRLKALVPMHTFGHPCDMQSIQKITKNYKIELVEDAAEALGSFYEGKHTGTFGKLGIISFNGNKIITTGGGGAILTNDLEIAKKVRHLIQVAKIPHSWNYIHDEIGYNYRMPNLNAALGCSQFDNLNFSLESKRRLFKVYKKNFKNILGIKIFEEPPKCKSNYWLQTILLSEENQNERDLILKKTNAAGIMTRPAWDLIHTLQPYRNSPRAPLPVSKHLSKRIINLPSSAGLA